MLILLVALLALAAATRVLVVAALFAVLLGGTFLPVVDALAKHHFPRWLGALLMAVFVVALAIGGVFAEGGAGRTLDPKPPPGHPDPVPLSE